MKLEKVFEADTFIIWQDNKGWDFVYDIENKTDKPIVIQYGDYDEDTIEIDDWIGILCDREYIVRYILEGNYKEVE